jgi:hypothetical protein
MRGQQVRQYAGGLRTNTVAVTTGGWTSERWGTQFSGTDVLDDHMCPSLAHLAPGRSHGGLVER